MAQRIVPSKVVTVTKEGECHVFITLDLNININAGGQFQVSPSQVAEPVEPEEHEEDKTEWQIPEFGTFNSNLLNFGKDVENANG